MGLNADCHFFRVRELEKRRKEEGKEDVDMEDVLDGFHRKARDHARTPMQVSSSSVSSLSLLLPP